VVGERGRKTGGYDFGIAGERRASEGLLDWRARLLGSESARIAVRLDT